MGVMFFVSLLMMKRVCTALIITLFFILPASGQDKAPEVEWERVVATEKWKAANDIVAIPSGGFAVAGYTYSEATKSNFWISRLDVTGQIIWEKSLGKAIEAPTSIDNKFHTAREYRVSPALE